MAFGEFKSLKGLSSWPLALEELGSSLVKEIKGIRNDVERGVVDLERVAWLFGEAKLIAEK